MTDDEAVDRWEGEGGAMEARGGRTAAVRPRRPIRMVRATVVTVARGSILVAGLALMVLSRPATVVILLGLAILATQLTWARRRLGWVRALFA